MITTINDECQWWIPETRNQAPSYGTLKVSESEIGIASLWGSIADEIHQLSVRGPTLLIGKGQSGNIYTCYDSICINRSTRSGQHGRIEVVDLKISKLFRGKHFDNINNIKFCRMYLTYSNLHTWTYHRKSVFEINRTETGENIFHNLNTEWNVQLANGFCIGSEYMINISHSIENPMVSYSHLDAIYIKHVEPKRPEEFEAVERTFRSLINFLGDCNIVTTVLKFHELCEGQTEVEQPDYVDFFSSKNLKQSEKRQDPVTNPVEFQVIEPNFPIIVKKWFEKESGLASVTNLYFQCRNNYHFDNTFIFLMQALESYHRRFQEGRYMEEHKYRDEVYSILVRAIPNTLEQSFRTKIKNMLKYAYEFSLRKRLTQLVSLLPNDQIFKETLNPDFIDLSVNTRNAIIHQLPDDRLTGSRLYVALSAWKLALFALILRELEFDDHAIRRATRRLDAVKGTYVNG